MIPNHPALHTDGRMRLSWCLQLQEKLISEYCKPEFQKLLYAGWHCTDDMVEKHKWRQKVSLEVQCQILPAFGFEGSRRGVYASGVACATSPELADLAVSGNAALMEWLVNPDQQADEVPGLVNKMRNWLLTPPLREGDRVASGYEICVTRPEDTDALFMIARCQGALVGAHQAMYNAEYPDLEPQQWFGLIGANQSCTEALDRGVLIWHAKAQDSGQVVGYISCTCCYGGGGAEGDDDDAKPHGQINNIVVLNQHRGCGVGKQLFDELLEHLSEACPSICADLRIVVVERNQRAKEWYERLGFAHVDDWIGYPNNHAVRFINMRRSLESDDVGDIWG